jgi:hypothetical protein
MQDVSSDSSFHSHYFQLDPSPFCEKNYLKFSLQFPAGQMELHSTPLLGVFIADVLRTEWTSQSTTQLSFALFYCFRIFAKRVFSNFRSNSRRATWNDFVIFDRMMHAQFRSDFDEF